MLKIVLSNRFKKDLKLAKKRGYEIERLRDVINTLACEQIPDGMVVCDRSKIKFDGVHGAPDLVVEVLSPRTAKNDRRHKMEVYASSGVREYWIVDPANKSVEQYLQEDGRLALRAVYAICPDYMLDMMTEAERAAIQTKFQCSLFNDLTIHLEDIFENVDTIN